MIHTVVEKSWNRGDMRMNKLYAILALLVCVSVLLGCGGGATTTPPTTAPPTTTPPTTAPPTTTPPTTTPAVEKLGPTHDITPVFGYDVEGLPEVTLIYPSSGAANTTSDLNARMFKLMVENESKGKIHVKHYPYGTLYSGLELYSALPKGQVSLMEGWNIMYMQASEPKLLPYTAGFNVVSTAAQMLAITNSKKWYEEVDPYFEKIGVKYIAPNAMTRWDFFAKVPITKMEDMRGLKMYTWGEHDTAQKERWGAIPTYVAPAELYMAYYKGQIDEYDSGVSIILDYKYYECGKYWWNMPTYPEGANSWHIGCTAFNLEQWRALPEAYKRIIIDATRVLFAWRLEEEYYNDVVAAYRLVNEKGVIDCGMSTKYPEETKRIWTAGADAIRDLAINKGVAPEFYDSLIKWKAQMAQVAPDYQWKWDRMYAEGAKRLNEALARIEAGENPEQVWASIHPTRFYSLLGDYEKLKAELLKYPRITFDWPMELMLK
jgi:TRAP-type C4-dicarboxylate transport system substrate-binding protein